MKEQVKAYCLEELRNIQHNWDAERAICRAYGAIMFYTNYSDEPEEDREEIRAWWNEKMLYSMIMEKKRQKEVK